MKTLLKILSVLILMGFITGGYFLLQDEEQLGNKIVGLSVLATAFILMPIWLYYSWRGKKLEDYTLTDKNIKKMKDINEKKRR